MTDTASDAVSNLRIHFYGVQGSGSVFPSRVDRLASQEVADYDLLESVFADIQQRHTDADGRITASIEDIIGGPVNHRNLLAYRKRFPVTEPRVYGGWTTCVRIETGDGHDIVIDCGSGFRTCAKDILGKWGAREDRELTILGSHSHYDHHEGFDQAAICFDPRNHVRIYANRTFLQALDQNLGIFSHDIDTKLKGVVTPLNFELMPAKFSSIEIRDLAAEPPAGDDTLAHEYHDIAEPLVIGQTTIQPFEVFHPSPCLAYRVERAGKVFVFCTDHELRHGDDGADTELQLASRAAEERLKAQSMNADLLYRDGQFFRVEYDGDLGVGSPFGVSRVDWGHSCVEDVMDMAEACNVQRTLIGHHDPNRDWTERNWIDETLQRRSEQAGLLFELARAEMVIDL